MFDFLQSLFDLRCLLCGVKLDRRDPLQLCSDCRQGFDKLEKDCCAVCGHPLRSGRCPSCSKLEAIHFDSFLFLQYYTDFGKKVIFKWKKEHYWRLGLFFLILLEQKGLLDKTVPVTIVPGAKGRRMLRGKSSLYFLLGQLKKSGYTILSDVYCMKPLTKEQKQKNAARRVSEVHSRFFLPGKNRNKYDGAVQLIDDLFTTGATLNYGAKLLKEAGFKKVTAISIFRTILNNR